VNEAQETYGKSWAVVTDESYGGGARLLWSRTYKTWLPSRRYGRGFVTEPTPGEERQPYEAQLAAIPELTGRLLDVRMCQRCGLSDLEDHFIAPDVWGNSTLYCVQRPAPTVVYSSGGGGDRKHWGSLSGCSSVQAQFLVDERFGEESVVYGESMVASHVRDYAWCSRCGNAAWNVSQAAAREGVSPQRLVEDQERRRLEGRASRRRQRTGAGPRS
jgi:hypothetical protein